MTRDEAYREANARLDALDEDGALSFELYKLNDTGFSWEVLFNSPYLDDFEVEYEPDDDHHDNRYEDGEDA